MNRPWQFSLASLLGLIVVASVMSALISRFGATGAYLPLLGGALLIGIVGLARQSRLTAGLGFAGFVVLLLIPFPLWLRALSQTKVVHLWFIVVDADDRSRIEGATLRLREPDGKPSLDIPRSEKGVWAATDSRGIVGLDWSFATTGADDADQTGRGLVHFGVSARWIQVSAQGYKTRLFPLDSLTGTTRDAASPDPPAMSVSLRPN